MPRILSRPKWLVASLVVVILAGLFVRLGFWQLDRLEQRRLVNQIGAARIAGEPVPLDELLESGDSVESLEYRRAVASGEYLVEEELLVRSQVYRGEAGFHVITPLLLEGGDAILVNRGWVPLGLDQPPVGIASPHSEVVVVEGWIHLTQPRQGLGPTDPLGAPVVSRVDIARIQTQIEEELAPVYLVLTGEQAVSLPIPVAPPDFEAEGPHLAYAIQWFGFALVGLVGFYFLLRRAGTQSM